MSLVPAGKLRIMVAQQIGNPLTTGGSESIEQSLQKAKDEQNKEQGNIQNTPVENTLGNGEETTHVQDMEKRLNKMQPQKESQQGGLADYLFEMYVQTFGYPPRVMKDVKNDFVEEELTPDGATRVTVTLPARYWSEDRRITSTEMKNIIQHIENKFHYYHNGTKIGDKEIKMELSSVDPHEDEKREQTMQNSTEAKKIKELYSLYGKQPPGMDGQPNEQQKKKAYTMSELIQMNKNAYMPALKKIVNGK